MKTVKRPIDTGFWEDAKVVDQFTPEDKYFFLYLLTNPHTSQVGIYRLPYKIAAFELGYSVEAVKSLLDRFENRYHVIAFSKDNQEVAVLNALKHNIVKGGKPVIDCIKSELQQVKSASLISTVNKHLQRYWQASDRKTDQVIQELFSESLLERKETKENTNENDNENDNENERIVDDSSTYRQNAVTPGLVGGYTNQVNFIIEYLNQKVGTHYRPTSYENKKLIKARLNEGATVDDFKTVIDKKVDEWLNTDMKRYLRPKTLFAPTHFDDYLNEPVRQQNNDDGGLGNAAPGWTV